VWPAHTPAKWRRRQSGAWCMCHAYHPMWLTVRLHHLDMGINGPIHVHDICLYGPCTTMAAVDTVTPPAAHLLPKEGPLGPVAAVGVVRQRCPRRLGPQLRIRVCKEAQRVGALLTAAVDTPLHTVPAASAQGGVRCWFVDQAGCMACGSSCVHCNPAAQPRACCFKTQPASCPSVLPPSSWWLPAAPASSLPMGSSLPQLLSPVCGRPLHALLATQACCLPASAALQPTCPGGGAAHTACATCDRCHHRGSTCGTSCGGKTWACIWTDAWVEEVGGAGGS